MSPLAFDKQGRPFPFSRRTKKLLVRLFRNPAARGACCQVLAADGAPLLIDVETDYVEFRKLVGNVPGLYRLDQCDEDGIEIEDAPPAYVSIDITRNLSSPDGGEVNPLVIIEHLVAIQADVMKTMAAQQAALISASAEILRAPYRPAPPTAVHDKATEDDADDDEDDDDELDSDDEPEDPWAAWRPLIKMAEPHLPKLGAFLYEQLVAYMKNSATPPAAAPTPAIAPASAAATSAPQTVTPDGAAAGPSPATRAPAPGLSVDASVRPQSAAPAPATSSTVPETNTLAESPTNTGDGVVSADAGESESDNAEAPTSTTTATAMPPSSQPPAVPTSTAAPTSAAPSTALAVATPAVTEAPRNASPAPTPEQWTHLYTIRERLSAKERAIAENAITRMTPDLLARWLGELSAMSVDDAIRMIRAMLARIRAEDRR